MTWCPKCREEFSVETPQCPRCDGELMPEVPTDENLMTDVEWVPVARNLEPIQAMLLKDELEGSGIPVVISGASVGTFHLYPNMENAVLVPRRWSDEAQGIVDVFLDADGEKKFLCSACGIAVPREAVQCPACGEALA